MIIDAFYNFNYNQGHERGQSKYYWGTNKFDINKPLMPQLLEKTKLNKDEVFNLNLTAFNPLTLQLPEGKD